MTALHPAFTPTAQDGDALDELTVGRRALISRLVERLSLAASTGTRAHTLVVGPGGSGKTHVLAVALHRALRDPDVASRLAVCWIPEDALAIGSYPDLLVELIRQLDPASAADVAELRRAHGSRPLEALLLRIAGDRSPVLVIENLDRVFANLGTAGAAGLRGFVETSGGVLVLASARLIFPGISSRDEPWFASLDVEPIHDLSLVEATDLMRARARARGDEGLAQFVGTDRGQVHLKVLERLLGGSARVWHLLAGAADVPSLEAVLPAIEQLLDDLTPYHQERLWQLPPVEQKLVVALGRADGMLPVSELADATGVQERVVATGLGRLTQSGFVRRQKAVGGDQRKTWYELGEPLLRHHLQYREGRMEAIRRSVEILRSWFSGAGSAPVAPVAPVAPLGARHLAASGRARTGWPTDPESLLRLPAEIRALTAPPASLSA